MAEPEETEPDTVAPEFANPAAVGLPAHSETQNIVTKPGETSSVGSTTTGKDLAPEAAEAVKAGLAPALAQQAEGGAQEVAAAEAQGAVNADKAKLALDKAVSDKAANFAAAEDKAALDAQHARAVALRIADFDKERKLYEKADIHDFWADKSLGYKIQARVAMALGAFGNALAGGGNPAMQIIDSQITQDFARQKLGIERMKDSLWARKYGMEMAQQLADKEDTKLLAKQAAVRQQILDTYTAGLAAKGIPQAQIDQDATVGKLKQAVAKPAIEAAEKFSGSATKEIRNAKTSPAEETKITDNAAKPTKDVPIRSATKKGVTFGTVGKAEAPEIQKRVDGYANFKNAIDELDEITKSPTGFSSEAAGKLQSITERMIEAEQDIQGKKRLSDSQVEIYRKLVGGGTGQHAGQALNPKLKGIIEGLRSDAREKAVAALNGAGLDGEAIVKHEDENRGAKGGETGGADEKTIEVDGKPVKVKKTAGGHWVEVSP